MGIAWVPNGKSSHSFWVQQQKTVTDAALFDTWALVCGRMSGIVSHAGLWMVAIARSTNMHGTLLLRLGLWSAVLVVALAGPHLLTVTTVALRHTRSGQHDCVRTTTTRHSTQTHTRGDLFLSMTYVPACFVLLACSRMLVVHLRLCAALGLRGRHCAYMAVTKWDSAPSVCGMVAAGSGCDYMVIGWGAARRSNA